MNSTLNRDSNRKENQMNAVTKATAVALLVALGLALAARAAETPKPEPRKGNAAAGGTDVPRSTPATQKVWRWDANWSIASIGGLKIPDASREYLGKLADQVWRRDLLVLESDRDALDIVLRRTRSLLGALVDRKPDLAKYDAPLRQFEERARQIDPTAQSQRSKLLGEVVKLRREIAFANPLLDFQQILFVKSHWLGHCVEQYKAFRALPGGGLCILEDAFGPEPKVRDLLAGVVVETGPMKGRSLEGGAFLSPALSYDGRTILFAWTRAMPLPQDRQEEKGAKKKSPGWGNCHTVENGWGDPDCCYHIFSVRADGTQLRQLTDGPWSDLFPCFLPDGRIVFVSERRGGYGRCFMGRPAPTFTLHRMNADGGDMVVLSWHETNEWHPSVTHAGSIVYTRWDYVDRGACIAHHPWLTSIDGRDARAIHGNYPADGDAGVRPHMEMEIRAIPGSQRYVATAAPHHGSAEGSLVIFDPRVPDDDRMGPVKRLTPQASFPEAEKKSGFSRSAYSAPYPLAEDFYLCSNAGSLCLIDGFGNQEILYPVGDLPLRNPIPLRPTPAPPVMPELSRPLPARTAVGKATTRPASAGTAETNEARVALVDVYNSRYPFPKDARITSLRIIQILPKTTPFAGNPSIAVNPGAGNNARRVLGIVPVESDGSAYFALPAGKAVYFQALDERGLAVQSMRSLMYGQPGERLSCAGCHEEPTRSPPQTGRKLLAMRREPSKLTSEIEGVTSWTYGALAAPAVQRSCVSCHRDRKVPVALGVGGLSAFGALYASETMLQKDPKVGGSRTLPGQFSVRASRLPAILEDKHHKGHIPMEDFRRIALWLDLGCPTRDDYGDGRNLD